MMDHKIEDLSTLKDNNKSERVLAYQLGKPYLLNQEDVENISGGTGHLCWTTCSPKTGECHWDCNNY